MTRLDQYRPLATHRYRHSGKSVYADHPIGAQSTAPIA